MLGIIAIGGYTRYMKRILITLAKANADTTLTCNPHATKKATKNTIIVKKTATAELAIFLRLSHYHKLRVKLIIWQFKYGGSSVDKLKSSKII